MHSTPRLIFSIESNYASLPYGSRRYGATEYIRFPVRVSVPAAPGRFSKDDRLEVCELDGKAVTGVVKPMLLWPDGSVRVWEVWMAADLKREEARRFELAAGSSTIAAAPQRLLQGLLEFTVTAILGDGRTASQRVFFLKHPPGENLAVQEDEEAFELRGSDGVLLFKGALMRRSWSWYPGLEMAIRAINYAPGDELSVKALTLEFDLTGRGKSRYLINHVALAGELLPRIFESEEPFDVRADGGGIHVADIRQVGREETDYAVYERGPYASAVDTWLGTRDDEKAWMVAVPEASERRPKGWSICERRVKLELHPEWAGPLAWRRGMALHQRFHLAQLSRDASSGEFEDEALRWLRPPLVTVDAEVYRAAGWRIPFRYQPDRFPCTEYTIRDTWSFSWTTGTFEWGDQVGQGKGTLPLPHGVPIEQGTARNLEYDFVACAAKEFARTGRPEVWRQCRASAEHMIHTDFVAVSDDPWQEGGIPHHCNRHTTGAAYPSHMWIEGLTLYHQLSGDRYSLTVAKRVGDFFLKYVDERFMVIESTGREMGWALVSLAAIYDLTREPRYLRGIQKIVDHYLKFDVKDFFPTDATFTIGVAIIGLDRVRPFHRDSEIKAFILAILDDIMVKRRDPMGIFDYNFDSERKGFAYIQTHLPEALDIGHRLSGDVKYLKAAWRLFQLHAAGAPLTVQNKYQTDCGYAAGYHITWTMGCLASFAERGWLDRAQFADPE